MDQLNLFVGCIFISDSLLNYQLLCIYNNFVNKLYWVGTIEDNPTILAIVMEQINVRTL